MFRVLSIVFVVASVITLAAPATALCNFFAAPTAAGLPAGAVGTATGAGTETDPYTVEQFWLRSDATPGTTLCLLGGLYRGDDSMIRPTHGLSGEPGNEIVVRTQDDDDGLVILDGEGLSDPVSLFRNDYWILKGFNAANGTAHVVGVTGTEADRIEGVVVRRVVAWEAEDFANSHVFDIVHADGVLLEDIAGFGTGRKTLQIYLSQAVTVRRAWLRWGPWGDGTSTENRMAITCAYRSYDVLCENVIASTTGRGNPIAADWLDPNDPLAGTDGFDAGLRILGSIAIVPDVPDARSGFRLKGMKGVEIEDVVSYVEAPGVSPLNIKNCEGHPNPGIPCVWNPVADAGSLQLTAVTEVGGVASTIDGEVLPTPPTLQKNWSLSDLEDADLLDDVNIFADDGVGARLCHRTEDGVVTSVKLWPWPMNKRIFEATAFYETAGTDVTGTIASLFGPIPGMCLNPTGPPGGGNCGAGAGLAVLVPLLLWSRGRHARRG